MVNTDGISTLTSVLWVTSNAKLRDFYTSSWQSGDSPLPMLMIRMFLGALALTIFLWSIIEAVSLYFLIYLTNWGVILVAGTTISGLAISCVTFWKKPLEEITETNELPWYVGVYWVFFNTAVSISVMITSLYWILLYNPVNRQELGTRLFVLDITKHGITSCIVMIELLVSRTPVRFAHIYQPLGISFGFSIFTALYYAVGGTDMYGNKYIYDVLDWQHPQQAVIVVLASISGLVVLYIALWIIALCRDEISKLLVRSQNENDPYSLNQLKLQIF